MLKRIFMVTAIAFLVPAASTPAHTLTPTITLPTVAPVEDTAFAIVFSGDTTGSSSSYPRLHAKARPAGGTPCGPSGDDDPGTRLDNIPAFGESVSGPFSITGTFVARAPGTYLICAWIEDNSDDFGPPASATVSVRPPMLRIVAAAPASVRRGVPFAVNISYGSEVPRYLTVLVVRASSCSIGSMALRGISTSTVAIADGVAVSGEGATAGSARFDDVGTYRVCGFLEESFDGSGVAQYAAQLATVSVVRAPATFRSCGNVGGRRHIRNVRARSVSCANAKALARRWGRRTRAPRRLGIYRCGVRSGIATCTAGSRQVKFRFGRA